MVKENSLKENSDFLFFGLLIVLDEYRQYQTFIEDFLKKEIEVMRESYLSHVSQLHMLDINSQSKILEHQSQKYTEIITTFPHNFRASFLIQIISLIESNLTELCEHYELTNKTKYSIHDLKGNSDIDKAKMYLTKSCEVDFNKLNPEWQFITMARKLRNKLVHNNGLLNKSEKDWKAIEKFNKNNYLKFPLKHLNNDSTIFYLKERKLIDELLKNTESFFKKLFQEVNY